MRTKSSNIREIEKLVKEVDELYAPKLVRRIINTSCPYLSKPDKQSVMDLVMNNMRGTDIMTSLSRLRRSNVLAREMQDSGITDWSDIDLLGFVTFRGKKYIAELNILIEEAVDDFLEEREYQDFISLLRYLMECSTPKFEECHVSVGPDHYIVKTDISDDMLVEPDINKYLGGEIHNDDWTLNWDDMLTSFLIAQAPKKVIFHNTDKFGNKELLRTIRLIFGDRLMEVNDDTGKV